MIYSTNALCNVVGNVDRTCFEYGGGRAAVGEPLHVLKTLYVTAGPTRERLVGSSLSRWKRLLDHASGRLLDQRGGREKREKEKRRRKEKEKEEKERRDWELVNICQLIINTCIMQ